MNLVGYDHVFETAIERELAPGLTLKLVSLPVFALLKIAAYFDRPYDRQEDVRDISRLLDQYGTENQRLAAASTAGVPYGDTGAYLLGRDIRSICSESEREIVRTFMKRASNEADSIFGIISRHISSIGDRAYVAKGWLSAFSLGFDKDERTQ